MNTTQICYAIIAVVSFWGAAGVLGWLIVMKEKFSAGVGPEWLDVPFLFVAMLLGPIALASSINNFYGGRK